MNPQQQISQLHNENQRLLQQNQALKQSLQQLIAVNSELTQTVQQFSNYDKLSDRIYQLESQNKSLKTQLHMSIRKIQNLENNKNKGNDQYGHAGKDMEKNGKDKENQELEMVIQELMEKSNHAQKMYESQIARLGVELREQKEHAQAQFKKLENSHSEKIKQYEQTIQQLKKKNESINLEIEKKVLKQSQQLMHNQQRKNLKVSTTIQDLRNVLTTQIQQKDRIINVYENLIVKLKQKIKQKF